MRTKQTARRAGGSTPLRHLHMSWSRLIEMIRNPSQTPSPQRILHHIVHHSLPKVDELIEFFQVVENPHLYVDALFDNHLNFMVDDYTDFKADALIRLPTIVLHHMISMMCTHIEDISKEKDPKTREENERNYLNSPLSYFIDNVMNSAELHERVEREEEQGKTKKRKRNEEETLQELYEKLLELHSNTLKHPPVLDMEDDTRQVHWRAKEKISMLYATK